MAGTCITTIKLVGVGSLGLLTGSLALQAVNVIPELIRELNIKLESGYSNLNVLKYGKYVNTGLLHLGVGCLYLAYNYSPVNEKHPYLIYSILGGIIGFGYTYYQTWNYEKSIETFEIPKPQNVGVVQIEKEDDLSKSYIHVSDDDSSTTNSTAPNLTPNSPNPTLDTDANIDTEINLTLYKKETIKNLENIQANYYIGAGLFAFTFLISSVGLVGDFVMG